MPRNRFQDYQDNQKQLRAQDPVLAAEHRESERTRKALYRRQKKEKAAREEGLRMANHQHQTSLATTTQGAARDATLISALATMRAGRREDDERDVEETSLNDERRHEYEMEKLRVEEKRIEVEGKRIEAKNASQQRRFDSEEKERGILLTFASPMASLPAAESPSVAPRSPRSFTASAPCPVFRETICGPPCSTPATASAPTPTKEDDVEEEVEEVNINVNLFGSTLYPIAEECLEDTADVPLDGGSAIKLAAPTGFSDARVNSTADFGPIVESPEADKKPSPIRDGSSFVGRSNPDPAAPVPLFSTATNGAGSAPIGMVASAPMAGQPIAPNGQRFTHIPYAAPSTRPQESTTFMFGTTAVSSTNKPACMVDLKNGVTFGQTQVSGGPSSSTGTVFGQNNANVAPAPADSPALSESERKKLKRPVAAVVSDKENVSTPSSSKKPPIYSPKTQEKSDEYNQVHSRPPRSKRRRTESYGK